MAKANKKEVVDGNGGRVNKIIVNLSKNNSSKKLIGIPNIKNTGKSTFPILNAKKILNYLKQTFIKTVIF